MHARVLCLVILFGQIQIQYLMEVRQTQRNSLKREVKPQTKHTLQNTLTENFLKRKDFGFWKVFLQFIFLVPCR